MKNIIYLFLFTFLFSIGCKENMPVIDCLSCEEEEKELEPQDRRVIIEEFTGVRCVNCPAGSAEIQSLLNTHGAQLIPISIHAGFYANSYPESQYDFSTSEGDNLETFLGLPEGYPTSVINRKLFNNEPDLQLEGATSWGGKVAQEVQNDAIITLEISTQWNSSTRNLTIGIAGEVLEAINEEVRVTVMITENDIVDAQLVPTFGVITDYVHKHVFRGTATAYNGDVVANSLNVGGLIDVEFTYSIPNDWVAENCNVVAFFHNGTTNKEILQADEEHVTE